MRLAAACALLEVAPGNRQALDIVCTAITSRDKVIRKSALQACVATGSRSKAIVPGLIAILDDEKLDEDTWILALNVLCGIGPKAASAIPAMEKLLQADDGARKHTFLSHHAAAFALAAQGKAGVPALIRAMQRPKPLDEADPWPISSAR